jgi:intracellular multiplication protein IcmO
MANLRGLEKRQEQDASLLIRDTRTLFQRIRDFFSDPRNASIILVTLGVTCFFFRAFADVVLVIGIIIFIYAYTRKVIIPFRMPKHSNAFDYNDIVPGTVNTPRKAGGIAFFGNEKRTNEELWFTNDDMRTHVLMFGSTGSGKTEALLSLSYNALVQGSGFIYVDGKGDNSLYSKIFSMLRYLGREDDLLLINFMTGARDIIGPQERRLSNTLNPFCTGSSSMLSQLVVSLMPSSSASPDGDMWKGRAIGFIEALMRVLVYMRDQGKILLDANSVRNYFGLDRLEAIYVDRLFIRDGQEPVNLRDIPSTVLDPIDNYMINLPGYNKEKKGKQVSQVLEQHGFITMQLTRVFTSLADTYGHILRTNLAEVDLRDVVLNRRILVVLLPALEKSPEELSNLGKVIVATLKAVMAAGLGEEVEGPYKELITKKPTSSPTPFMCILDEYGYYAVEGFAVVPAQARSLGFSVIFAGQDLPALQKASKEEAASIGGNTNIKIAMKIEDPTETWEFFQKTAGEAYVTKVDAFQTNAQSVFNNYMDTRSASAEKRGRVDLLDLKDQREGEAHIFFRSQIIRANLFYANPKPVAYMRLNQHLKIEKPVTKTLLDFEARLQRFRELSEKDDFALTTDEQSADILFLKEVYDREEKKNLIERGIDALIAYHNKSGGSSETNILFDTEATEQKIEQKPVEKPQIIAPPVVQAPVTPTIEKPIAAPESAPEFRVPSIEMPAIKSDISQEQSIDFDIFRAVHLIDLAKKNVKPNELERFAAPLLNKSTLDTPIAYIERLTGQVELKAKETAKLLVRDMEQATRYPPILKQYISEGEVLRMMEELTEGLKKMK